MVLLIDCIIFIWNLPSSFFFFFFFFYFPVNVPDGMYVLYMYVPMTWFNHLFMFPPFLQRSWFPFSIAHLWSVTAGIQAAKEVGPTNFPFHTIRYLLINYYKITQQPAFPTSRPASNDPSLNPSIFPLLNSCIWFHSKVYELCFFGAERVASEVEVARSTSRCFLIRVAARQPSSTVCMMVRVEGDRFGDRSDMSRLETCIN